MKKIMIAALLLLTLLPSTAFSTAQIGELLIYKGQTYEMYSTPLESYFSKENPRPESPVVSTGCWRGYIGVWKIANGTLCLVSLHHVDHDAENYLGKEISFEKIFPKQKPPIPAIWFSGVLRLPQGEILRYVHMGFGTIYEKDLYITIKEGKVTAQRNVDNKGKGATQSTPDLQWVALAEEPVEDDGNWYDARLIRTGTFTAIMESGRNFMTRGIFLNRGKDEPSYLWIPDTPTTRSEYLPMHSLPEKHQGRGGSHVEIRAHFVKEEKGYRLHVDSIKELKPGETMHHPNFNPPNKTSGGDVQ